MVVPLSLLSPFGSLLNAGANALVEHVRARNRAAEAVDAERAHEWAKDEASHRAALWELKAQAEELLKAAIIGQLDALADGQSVMLKLTLPDTDGF